VLSTHHPSRPRSGHERPSVILLSGGLDSAANLALCHFHDQPLLALTCDYGQQAARREIEAAGRLARHFGVPHQVVELKWLGALGGSSLTEISQDLPEPGADQLDDPAVTGDSARAVWVPNRNGVLINVASAFAERLGAERVVVGFNREEAATFPDNSQAFIESTTRALGFSTANHVRLFSYTTNMDKREIVSELSRLEIELPLGLVWSCYRGGDSRCGKCESCRRFERATSGPAG